jgi:phytoene synthase
MLPRKNINQASGYASSTALDTSTFDACVRLLPGDLRSDIRMLYQVLRTIDDLVDDQDPQAEQRVEAIERWARSREVDSPETRILTNLSKRHILPSEAIIEFCRGMRHDLAHAEIATDTELEQYCQQVGGAVGVMLARIFGNSDPHCDRKMATLGRAAQRTNILRDIDEDHAHGRVYLPRTAIERFGLPTPGAREKLLRDQIAHADQLYEDGREAISLLPRGQRSMALAVSLYREILRQIEREGYGRTAGRVTLPMWRKYLLVFRNRLRFETA